VYSEAQSELLYHIYKKYKKISNYMFVVNAFKCGLFFAVSAPVNEMNEGSMGPGPCTGTVNAPVTSGLK
jgi:hypothetical protein